MSMNALVVMFQTVYISLDDALSDVKDMIDGNRDAIKAATPLNTIINLNTSKITAIGYFYFWL